MMTLKESTSHFGAKALAWLPVILLIALAAWIRYTIISPGNYLLIGGDGPYYPLQVRSLLEHHQLAYPDMPLLFIVQAALAAVLNFFHAASYQDCIILAVKATDVILPPLAAIPVFLIAKELRATGNRPGALSYLVVAFAVINLSMIGAFANGLQKNAVAVIWVFLYVYYMIRLIKYSRKKDAFYAGTVLLLCALTHFGSCALLIFLSLLSGISWLLYNRQALRSLHWKKYTLFLAAFLLAMTVIAMYDSGRFQRLMTIPFKIFEFPVFLLMLNGYGLENFLSPIHLLLTNFLALLALILILANRKKTDKDQKLIAFAMIAAAFFLASPLIGLEWANRLYIISYIPIVIVYLIVFNAAISKWIKAIPATIFMLYVMVCFLGRQANRDCITAESYDEFVRIKDQVRFDSKDAIIGRQDLRILGSWEFGTKSVVEYLFRKEDFDKYHAVYVIRQLKGSNFPPGRFRGDARVPDNAVNVYAGICFELYRLNSGEGWKRGKGKASKAHGVILALTPHYMILQNDQGFQRTVELTDHTILETPLQRGKSVEVWGNWKPFSLNVVAESVSELQ